MFVYKNTEDAFLPTTAYTSDVGYDFYSIEDKIILPNSQEMFDTQIIIALQQENTYMSIHARSSLAKKNIIVPCGIIDPGYRGTIKIILRNLSTEPIKIEKGDRIAQGIVHKFLKPELIQVFDKNLLSYDTERNVSGFGSSGK